ncbi:MAG: hypothetical protein KIS76_14365 [Pyrinomonadaceae bacterium]|nr:hypothetical protein [Pyrinomonadaceae bacterium]
MTASETGKKKRAPRNRTIDLNEQDLSKFRSRLMTVPEIRDAVSITDKTICGDLFQVLEKLPERSFDLIFADPPYNLTKEFGVESFRQTSLEDYEKWLDSWLSKIRKSLKETASVYICGDWRSASAIQRVGMRYFTLRSRITWEREKGRGARKNWKNAAEDIWFFTVSDEYVFNLEDVKTKRKVIAPYTENGEPKDWQENTDGKFRMTHPSNVWTDITVPFWSMPENTDHPTQKPEKLLAKIILASTNEKDLIFDPFAGSGTTAVVARKLGRRFTAVEVDEHYCLLAEKRLAMAEEDGSIQGFSDGVFYERNTAPTRAK